MPLLLSHSFNAVLFKIVLIIKLVTKFFPAKKCVILQTYSSVLYSVLAAHSSANNVQAEHHCLQVYSWGSSILSDEFMCSCRY